MNYQCPKCRCSDFVVVAPCFHITNDWLGRVVKVVSGYLVRCTRHGCGREWVITKNGVDEPGVTTPSRVVQIPAREEEKKRREVEDPLDRVERPDV